MRTIRTCVATLTLLTLVHRLSAQPAPSQPATIPKQDIVFVIDNSGSMTHNDPLSLRGVAAGLVLDAVEVSSDVQAGLVNFSDAAQTDGKLNPPYLIRQRLQADHLPIPGGSTNMEDALSQGLAILSGSTASIKRLVLITDGQPEGLLRTAAMQRSAILTNLVPHAQQSGIQIFALGLTKEVDRDFLNAVTTPTGGKTLISDNQQHLLESAKELVGELDNVFNLAHLHLPSDQSSYTFELPHGTDRARVTAILDHPQEFSESEIEFAIDGPGQGALDYTYKVRTNGSDRVAARTMFISTPGKYTVHISSTKPGVPGHLGLQLYVEALSTLRVQLAVNPPSSRLTFGDEVRVEATITSGSGTVDPSTLKISGVVRNEGGGSTVIAFSGANGLFKVPDVGGHHTILVHAETPLAKAEAHYEYEAVRVPCALQADRTDITFSPLGPTNDTNKREESLLLSIDPPDVKCRAVRYSFTITSPIGIAELADATNGTTLRSGSASYAVPPQGQKLKLRIQMDPNRRLPATGGKYDGDLAFSSKDAGDVIVHFRIPLQLPEFKLIGRPDVFSLWWDPHQQRIVHLGMVHTDLSTSSTFTAIIPDALYDSGNQTKIANLALRSGAHTPDPEPIENGKLRYAEIELPPGNGVPLELVVTPEAKNGWERLPSGESAVLLRLTSSLGMEEEAKPRFVNVGPMNLPFLGVRSRHGKDIATVWFLAAGAAILLWLFAGRLQSLREFWSFRDGALLTLRAGTIEIGTGGGGSALTLPNSGSPLDDSELGRVYTDRKGQRLESLGPLVVPSAILAPGDTVAVVYSDPVIAEETPVWEFQYIDYSGGEGELEITASPAPWTVGKLARRTLLGAATLALLYLLLRTTTAASVAYSLRFLERLYVK
jgi:hypothetical protein